MTSPSFIVGTVHHEPWRTLLEEAGPSALAQQYAALDPLVAAFEAALRGGGRVPSPFAPRATALKKKAPADDDEVLYNLAWPTAGAGAAPAQKSTPYADKLFELAWPTSTSKGA
ncbi:hypothetical protein [Aestuariimicrobium sp. T2.26MG-19.2B]|uniref:hypothetical protein n=1 Tax=Aestuariimicrobium sp. T2.26MG-19.2B TaxID=3040679 RepID=UPI002477BCCC|nr:hypothetical protein [Aestuariimicrobium sp. T2.26MG-19.2B]CAI9400419.1 hypothetical protein AESSP_00384 [Aestuariimicrobium sp. T2.26MG-19.2B]